MSNKTLTFSPNTSQSERRKQVICFRLRVIFGASSLLILTSCGGPSVSSVNAYVTEKDALRAYAIISGIDYLPYGVKVDGCEQRGLFMAMELAAEKIPSSVQFVIGGIHYDRDDPHAYWLYHVAPMLYVGSDPDPVVIDPTVLEYPTKRSEWIRKLRADGTTTGFTFAALPGTYAHNPPQWRDAEIVRTFDELPKFDLERIGASCRTLRHYLTYEMKTDKKAKRAKIARRARELAEQLLRLGKLKNSPGEISTLDCGDNW